MPKRTPLKPDDDEKGVIFRGDDYAQLHELRVRTGAPSYKDAAMNAIRRINATLRQEQASTGTVDQRLSPFLDEACLTAEREDADAIRDLLGLVNTLVVHMADDEDGGEARLQKAREDGLAAATAMPVQGQANLAEVGQ